MENEEKSFGRRLIPLWVAIASLGTFFGALKYSSTPREFESRIRTPDGVDWNAKSQRVWHEPALDYLILDRVDPQNSTQIVDNVNFFINPETGEFEGAGIGSSKFIGHIRPDNSKFTDYKTLFEEIAKTGHSQPHRTRIGYDLARLANRQYRDQIRNYERNATNVSVVPTRKIK